MTIDALPRSCRGGVYGIAVTSELTGIGPQTLRLYERRGLLTPARTSGGTRRYSEDDLVRLARIAQLMEDGGVNVPGIRRILALESENADLASRLEGSGGATRPESDPYGHRGSTNSRIDVGLRLRSSRARASADVSSVLVLVVFRAVILASFDSLDRKG